jgi:hypothetical protein
LSTLADITSTIVFPATFAARENVIFKLLSPEYQTLSSEVALTADENGYYTISLNKGDVLTLVFSK